MKAAVYNRYGPPDVVSIQEIAVPEVKDDEILLRVHASTVNRTDAGFRSAEYFISRFFSGFLRPKYKVLGCEFSGTVVETGTKVKKYKIADQLFGFNDTRFGGHAEYMLLKENDAIVFIPEGLDFESAAAISEGAHYALENIRAAKVDNKSTVLVNGATGAIGSAAVQILKNIGARVVAVCDTKNLVLVKSLGADYVIDYTKEDFTLTNENFDFVFDAVGKSSFWRCRKILKNRGIFISTELGKYGANVFWALLGPLMPRKKVLFPLPTIRIEDLEFLKNLVSQGKFKPVIDRVYPLEKIVEAHEYVDSGMKTGNVIIKVI